MLSQISHVHEGREGRVVVVLERSETMEKGEILEGIDGERITKRYRRDRTVDGQGGDTRVSEDCVLWEVHRVN